MNSVSNPKFRFIYRFSGENGKSLALHPPDIKPVLYVHACVVHVGCDGSSHAGPRSGHVHLVRYCRLWHSVHLHEELRRAEST